MKNQNILLAKQNQIRLGILKDKIQSSNFLLRNKSVCAAKHGLKYQKIKLNKKEVSGLIAALEDAQENLLLFLTDFNSACGKEIFKFIPRLSKKFIKEFQDKVDWNVLNQTNKIS